MNELAMAVQEDRVHVVEDEADRPADSPQAQPWPVLIVDDDEQVHTATLFALSGVSIQGCPLRFLHAYSAEEAKRVLDATPGIAVVFLDLVMEADDAGLRLVRWIREERGWAEMRIILHTGQPGYAPEVEAIRSYDINDYRTRAEFTRARLLTSLTAAIRSYEQIRTISSSRAGLERIVRATAELFAQSGVEAFAGGVLAQIGSLLGVAPAGVVCGEARIGADGEGSELRVLGAAGAHAGLVGQPISGLADRRLCRALAECIEGRRNVYGDAFAVLYLKSGAHEAAAFVDAGRSIDGVERQLIDVFTANVAVGFANVNLLERLHFLACHDTLTGLPNRRALVEAVDAWCKGDRHEALAVVLIDIDHFSEVNDALGSAVGDDLIRAVVERVSGGLPGEARLGRYGGDVLGVVGPQSTVNARALIELFAAPFQVGEYSLPISASAGEVHPDEAAVSGVEVFRNASLALSRAKRGARGDVVTYTAKMAHESRLRLTLMQSLRRAIRGGEFKLHYQPQIALDSGRVIGAEALLRWRREDGTTVSPALFVPLAEQTGLITELGEWVMFEACRQLWDWTAGGFGNLRLAINVSAPQFRQGACTGFLSRALTEAGLRPDRIEVEITESMVMEDIDATVKSLCALKELGVGVAIDDFGTGFSSLAYLQRLPIDALKVDRAFVRDAGRGNGEKIGQMIVALGKTLGLATVAEGVETAAQQAAVRRWGCEAAQGFLYSEALPAREFAEWMGQRRARHAH